MLLSLALIFLLGLSLGALCRRFRLPSLVGMLITGILLGPYTLNLIAASILSISGELRQIALVIILTRAGLSLNINDLKKIGRPALLMCFVPACFEIAGMYLLAPHFLGISRLDALILGTVIAAVSPAVIVPRMISLTENGYGTDKKIPQLIMAGASVDDIFVIVLFSSFTSLASGDTLSPIRFLEIPVSIGTGIIGGVLCGLSLSAFFKKFHMRDSIKVLLILSFSFILVSLENIPEFPLPFSGLLAIMAIGITLLQTYPALTPRLSAKYNKLWLGAEVLLFVLVGATVDIAYAAQAGIPIILLLLFTLIFRMAGVLCCLIHTPLVLKEKLFCMIAYIPKATVQAAIGGIPLAMGLGCGSVVLTAAVVAILLTAPLGALGIDITYHRWLNRQERSSL